MRTTRLFGCLLVVLSGYLLSRGQLGVGAFVGAILCALVGTTLWARHPKPRGRRPFAPTPVHTGKPATL